MFEGKQILDIRWERTRCPWEINLDITTKRQEGKRRKNVKKKASKNLNQDGLRRVNVDVRCQISVEDEKPSQIIQEQHGDNDTTNHPSLRPQPSRKSKI